jgi:hypothetical protein
MTLAMVSDGWGNAATGGEPTNLFFVFALLLCYSVILDGADHTSTKRLGLYISGRSNVPTR